MADVKTDVTPDGTTTPDPTQPQADPSAAPTGTTATDDQPGTTGEGTGKEPLYQTKYQSLVETLTAAGIDPKNLGDSITPASLAAALPGQQETVPPPDPDAPPAEEEPDLYTQEGMKKYMDQNFGQIRGNLNNVVTEALAKARAEEKARADWDNEKGGMDKWLVENKVPQDVVDAAVKQYYTNFGQAGTPKAFVSTVKGYIKETSQKQNLTAEQQKIIAEAVTKANELTVVPVADPGAPPSPTTKPEATWQQKEADDIAPDVPYEPPL